MRAYERKEEIYDDDLWLWNAGESQLIRLTSGSPEDIGAYWSPDGTRLVFRRDGVGLVTLSLQTGNVTLLDVNLSAESSYDYAVGGNK